MPKILFFVLLLLFVNACNQPLKKWFLTTGDVVNKEKIDSDSRFRKPGRGRECCRDKLSYIPDTNYLEHAPVKIIRLNFHIMNAADSSQNFREKEGVKYVKSLLGEANKRLLNNHKMKLPPGNQTPVLPPRYRFQLTPKPDDAQDDGVYFHYDDSLYYYVVKGKNQNNYSRGVIQKYGIQLDTVLNVFLMPHHPDSLASPTYGGYGAGIALWNAVKLTGAYKKNIGPWDMQKYLNHETGHIYGLTHTWKYNDGCEDTPTHPNCFNNKTRPECDSLASNNFMDYNVYQNAWSPCQIGKIQYNMSREKIEDRKFLKPNWCMLHDERHIIIRDSVHWKSMKDLEGNLTIEDGGILKISCRVSLPKGAKITIKPGGKLILDNCKLHNACGDKWQGIEIQKEGKRKGKVVFWGLPLLEDMLNQL